LSKGVANWIDLVHMVFLYLSMLRASGPQEYIFEEIKAVSEMKFGERALSHAH
jgi:secreted Zn-dependent insulinase-like peptidase